MLSTTMAFYMVQLWLFSLLCMHALAIDILDGKCTFSFAYQNYDIDKRDVCDHN